MQQNPEVLWARQTHHLTTFSTQWSFLIDLSWLPTALYPSPEHPELPELSSELAPELSPELCTPVQDTWNIIDKIGATEEVPFDLEAS